MNLEFDRFSRVDLSVAGPCRITRNRVEHLHPEGEGRLREFSDRDLHLLVLGDHVIQLGECEIDTGQLARHRFGQLDLHLPSHLGAWSHAAEEELPFVEVVVLGFRAGPGPGEGTGTGVLQRDDHPHLLSRGDRAGRDGFDRRHDLGLAAGGVLPRDFGYRPIDAERLQSRRDLHRLLFTDAFQERFGALQEGRPFVRQSLTKKRVRRTHPEVLL